MTTKVTTPLPPIPQAVPIESETISEATPPESSSDIINSDMPQVTTPPFVTMETTKEAPPTAPPSAPMESGEDELVKEEEEEEEEEESSGIECH